MNILCNLGNAEADWDLKQMDQFRAFLRGFVDRACRSKWAIVAPAGPTAHNARLFIKLNESLGGKINMCLFSSCQEAEAWFAAKEYTTSQDR